MKTTLRQAAGSLLVVGLETTSLTGMERAWLKLVRPGGIILFRRNIEDAAQTHALLTDATALAAPNAFRKVDVEGGMVDRLRDALAPMPSVQAVAAAARRPRHAGLTRQHGELIARGVKAFGFNTSLAPVLDLGLPASAAVMGTRTASATAEGVTAYATEFLAGLDSQGVVGCGKHFPGLGAGTLDSHVDTPFIDRTWSELWREDLAPYRALHSQLPMVMMNHAAYPATSSKQCPASVSAWWIETVLRKRIGYRGLVLSDDLEMGGILKFMPIDEAVVSALRAGSDLFLVCHHPEPVLQAFEALLAEAERSAAFSKLLLARAANTARARARILPGKPPRPLSAAQFQALRERILRFSDTVAKAQENTPA